MLKELNKAAKGWGTLNKTKTQLIKNPWCEGEQIKLGGSPDHGDYIVRVPWTFNEYDDQHERGSKHKKESSTGRT
ncbi:hypothetical protein KIN20_006192 [Parelaphostrongylus tenuis]|uniref:Uncharacterized protein n=1 Tax=Parelaphostrongylus tenuis TaxID=148309 RepID=A0AAD5MJZ3_PARTN|nr:hypothetical protein KIN20_006192 [Parelaphostrongylus tenuis]